MATVVSNLLTLIITTSPTPSAPSSELLSTVLDSFRDYCGGLLTCPVVVVFDSFDEIVAVARLKKGSVTLEQAQNYASYKENVKALILKQLGGAIEKAFWRHSEDEAEYGSPGSRNTSNSTKFTVQRTEDGRVTFVEPLQRLGFGLAVRSALRLVTTPYVWVQQHDWALTAEIPLVPLLNIMRASEPEPGIPVKYVCFPSTRMLSYANSGHVQMFSALRDLTSALRRTFTSETHPEQQIPLTPLFFWHDKPHVATTSHYLERVFPSRLAMARGAFIEDTVGQRARAQMKEGKWAKWACWLYYPDDGKQLCLRHLQGRTWRGKAGEEMMRELWIRQNMEAATMKTAPETSIWDDDLGIDPESGLWESTATEELD